jgi:hypothetical protein
MFTKIRLYEDILDILENLPINHKIGKNRLSYISYLRRQLSFMKALTEKDTIKITYGVYLELD